MLEALARRDLSGLRYYRFLPEPVLVGGVPVSIARCGYTGELGYELYTEPAHAARLLDAIIGTRRVRPYGMRAMETLRREAGLILLGIDFEPGASDPFELGLDRVVRLAKPAFRGRDALIRRSARGLARRLASLVMDGERAAGARRRGARVRPRRRRGAKRRPGADRRPAGGAGRARGRRDRGRPAGRDRRAGRPRDHPSGVRSGETATEVIEREEHDVAIVATPTGAFIGGQWVDGDGERIDVHSPSTGELVGSVQASTPAQVDAAVAAAKAAFPAWRATSVLERVEICRRAFDMCMERNEEIARMISMEVGKTIRESREEMEEFTVDHFRRASEDVLRHTGAVHPSTQERTTNKRILVVQEPIGVIAAVSPWNFPVDIAGIPIVYGLALGCTVVWKPSEYAPLCAQMFTQLLSDAGFPPGTINVVHGRGETGAQVVRHPDVASIVFTGSVETGEKVARDAGLKNRVLELGGNGPQIVLADGDLEKAADAAIVGCFYLAGQCCTAAERILVHSSVKDRFVELLVERARGLKVGDPLDDETDMGPLCTPAVLERTQQHVADAVDKGATVVLGGGSDGQFHEPTVIDGVTSAMRIAQEETFGPVAPIMAFDTLDEALAIANETEYGLTASVFTRSLHDAWRAAEALQHGTVHINETTNYWDQLAPFGGAKKSGSGRELAAWIIDALTETKQITFDLG